MTGAFLAHPSGRDPIQHHRFWRFVGLLDSLTELVPSRYLDTAYVIRSVLGFGIGVVSPVVFGMVLDHFRTGSAVTSPLACGLVFATLGVGGSGPRWVPCASAGCRKASRWPAGAVHRAHEGRRACSPCTLGSVTRSQKHPCWVIRDGRES